MKGAKKVSSNQLGLTHIRVNKPMSVTLSLTNLPLKVKWRVSQTDIPMHG